MTIPTETNPPSAEATPLSLAVATAAALIELAIQDSLAPIEALGRAIARIAAAAPSPALAPELAACVESLQFHDRMTQQLIQARDLLAGAAGEPAPPAEPRDWPALRERLRAHFTTDSHRMLLNLLLPAGDRHGHARLHADENGVELF